MARRIYTPERIINKLQSSKTAQIFCQHRTVPPWLLYCTSWRLHHARDFNLESGTINGVRSIECNSFTKSPKFAEVKGKSI